MMANNIVWLDFNDAPEQRDELASDTDALRVGLLERLEAVLHYLFPQGGIRAGKFTIGDVDGNPGKSLVVELDGPRRGLWKDFSTDEGGDVIDLWARSQGRSARSDFPRIAGEIRQWLGLAPKNITLMRRDVRSVPIDDLGAYTAKWDYLSPEGELIACVYRYDPPTGKEYRPWDVRARMWRAPDPRPLYNLPVISKAREVVLVEGEKCATALIGCGIAATTAMNGAKAPVDKTDWHPLAGKSVVIWPDRDAPGWDYAESAARACVAAGSTSVAILVPPTDKPAKWDAADAVDEGFDCAAFISQGERRVVKAAAPSLPTFTLGELLDDQSPLPPDLISPRVLTPAGMLVFGGAPKVGKSDFLLSWLAHMAAGAAFLGIQRTHFGRDLPEIPVDANDLRTVMTTFRDHPERQRWSPVAHPAEGDAVLLRQSRHPVHVGVWLTVDGGGVLHAVKDAGVVFQKLPELLLHGWRVEGYYRFVESL